MSHIALTKCLDPEKDYPALASELERVDTYFATASPQHTHRRFEYALALRAAWLWQKAQPHRSIVRSLDVGGAGSPFYLMVSDSRCEVVDPAVNVALVRYVHQDPQFAQIIFCLSVLEHVDDLDQFLYHLTSILAPGGLLFLTMDCWNKGEKDDAHFHWMRNRIFTMKGWRILAEVLETQYHCALFGEADWSYHGSQVYDYSFASLALIKRP